MKAVWIEIACAFVIVPLATSGPSGPQSAASEVLDATAAVLAATAGPAAAARAVMLPPPARRTTAARPASSFLFMMSPCACLPFVLTLRRASHSAASAVVVGCRSAEGLRRPLGEGQVPPPPVYGLPKWFAHGSHALAHGGHVAGRLSVVSERERSDRWAMW